MSASAACFGIPFDLESATNALTQAVANGSDALRIRLTLSEAGELNCTAAPLPVTEPKWRYTISQTRVLSGDILLRHKSSRRELFDAEHARAITSGYDEVVFLNERGEITEGSRTNVFALSTENWSRRRSIAAC